MGVGVGASSSSPEKEKLEKLPGFLEEEEEDDLEGAGFDAARPELEILEVEDLEELTLEVEGTPVGAEGRRLDSKKGVPRKTSAESNPIPKEYD